jgi:hypothetical protein
MRIVREKRGRSRTQDGRQFREKPYAEIEKHRKSGHPNGQALLGRFNNELGYIPGNAFRSWTGKRTNKGQPKDKQRITKGHKQEFKE